MATSLVEYLEGFTPQAQGMFNTIRLLMVDSTKPKLIIQQDTAKLQNTSETIQAMSNAAVPYGITIQTFIQSGESPNLSHYDLMKLRKFQNEC